jgi:hypothetical protein
MRYNAIMQAINITISINGCLESGSGQLAVDSDQSIQQSTRS